MKHYVPIHPLFPTGFLEFQKKDKKKINKCNPGKADRGKLLPLWMG